MLTGDPVQLAVTVDSGFEMTCQAVYWVIRGHAGQRKKKRQWKEVMSSDKPATGLDEF